MILSLQIPELGMGIKKARVAEWNVQEGESISFGDVVCVLQVREWEMAGRTKDASRLAKLRKKGREQTSGMVKMRCPTCGNSNDLATQVACQDCLRFQVMASEPGLLSSIEFSEGEEVTVGAVLALVETEGEGSESGNHPKMRIVVDMMDRAEGDK